MRPRFLTLCFCALAAMLFAAGCGRHESSSFTAEIDEPNYRRGKDLLRQGRNQEALASFLKVVEKRGDEAPESHLELGILYQQSTFKDPIAAIYHYRKFRELKPNSPQSDLVRQRIDAATREFARTLPAQPLENQMERLDLLEKIDLLQRENLQLKEQLIGARTQSVNSPRSAPAPAAAGAVEPLAPLAIDPTQSPIVATPEPVPEPAAPAPAPVPVAPPQPAPSPAAAAGRRYVVKRGDTLFAIAKQHYGSATNARVQGILNANRGVLPSAGALQPGMTLIIP